MKDFLYILSMILMIVMTVFGLIFISVILSPIIIIGIISIIVKDCYEEYKNRNSNDD